MKFLLTSFLVILIFFNLKGQSHDTTKCLLFQQIMETPIFNREFGYDQNLQEDFIIVDVDSVLFDCSIKIIKNRNVIIVNSMPSKVQLTSNRNVVILSFGQKKNCYVSFGITSFATGSTITIYYEFVDTGYKLLGYRLGDLNN